MKLATVSWTFGLEELDELFAKVQSIGFSALQFCGDFRRYSPPEVIQTARKYAIEIVGYDPFNCQPPNKESATLENSVAFYRQVIDYAADLKAPVATLQGLSFWTTNQADYESGMQQIIEAVRQLNDYAKTQQVLLTYEACCHYETPLVHTADELLRILHESQADNLKLVLDSFHMNIDEPNPLDSLRKINGERLYSYHVSDSGRGGMGTGHIDFQSQRKVLEEIGFDGLVCFETVIPECRPAKFPMNAEQMAELSRQLKASLTAWQQLSNK